MPTSIRLRGALYFLSWLLFDVLALSNSVAAVLKLAQEVRVGGAQADLLEADDVRVRALNLVHDALHTIGGVEARVVRQQVLRLRCHEPISTDVVAHHFENPSCRVGVKALLVNFSPDPGKEGRTEGKFVLSLLKFLQPLEGSQVFHLLFKHLLLLLFFTLFFHFGHLKLKFVEFVFGGYLFFRVCHKSN